MPDERELKIRHTSEGADKVRADINSISGAEKKLGEQTVQAGTADDDLKVKKENLINVLNRIHPALGGYVDTLIHAVEAAGALGTANLTLAGTLEVVRASILKNAAAFKLLGAGGAAVAAVMFLIGRIRALKQELEDVLKLQDRIAEQNRQLIDKARTFEDMLVSAVEGGEIAPPTTDERQRMRREFNLYVREGFSDQVAFDISANRRPPPGEAERQLVRGVRSEAEIRKRIVEELSKGKELGTRELDFIKEMGFTPDDVKRLRNLIARGMPEQPGVFFQPPPLSPEEFPLKEQQLHELASRLGLLPMILDRLEQIQPRFGLTAGEEVVEWIKGFIQSNWVSSMATAFGGTNPVRSDPETLRLFGLDPEQRERTNNAMDQSAPTLLEAAHRLNEAARNMAASAELQNNVNDRAAFRLSSNGTTPRQVAAMGMEG